MASSQSFWKQVQRRRSDRREVSVGDVLALEVKAFARYGIFCCDRAHFDKRVRSGVLVHVSQLSTIEDFCNVPYEGRANVIKRHTGMHEGQVRSMRVK